MAADKVELLAPAGNYESFIGAINAGADAVYVGGEKFSARAYADNFTTEVLCACISYAHLFGKRVYLTLNTLIKEQEFSEVYEYVKPFYLAGLDGVIVQDVGVLRFLKQHFPHMELHASTQMAVTGPEFVSLCKELGICRVVPARELSLAELKQIRDAGIEVECFIHGAMCYCYSGMCLMSSILGGRSGNRGRCAQPCRLPYQVSVQEKTVSEVYTLSLKDMCTIEHIPELIAAGMNSFKIEGRMKRSEYAAGVTALYRKYIEKYEADPKKAFCVSKKDKEILQHLYIRSELQDGYLFKHNGKEMVTKDAPSYNALDEQILAEIRTKYLGYTKKMPISFYAYFEVGQPASLTAYTQEGMSVTVTGPIVEAAQKSPATKETISKQLTKLGGTHFSLSEIEISLEGDAFLPNGVLNALRREALEQLQQEIILQQFPDLALRSPIEEKEQAQQSHSTKQGDAETGVTVLVKTAEQLQTVIKHEILQKIHTVYMEDEAMQAYIDGTCMLPDQVQIVYAMPYILRAKDTAEKKEYLQKLYEAGVHGVLVRNVESLACVKQLQRQYPFLVVTDASLYCWNVEAKRAWMEYADRVTLPFELNSKELRALKDADTEQVMYGYLPLMVAANCIYKTNMTCQIGTHKRANLAYLKDRYGKTFTALTDCKYCYNIIYNSVPLSLHKKYTKKRAGYFRLQFSIESMQDTEKILDYYVQWMEGSAGEFPIAEYTTAHENRQVE